MSTFILAMALPGSTGAHCDTLDGPVVTLAQQALDTGNVKLVLPRVDEADEPAIRRAAVEQLLTDAIRQGLRQHFRAASTRKDFEPDDVGAGRDYVGAYVRYVHYVEALWKAAVSSAEGHYPEAGPVRHAEHRVSASGAALYRESCASCHGLDGRGNGPVAPLIKATIPDLTRISARRDGKFPADEVYRIIDGQSRRASRDTRSMPVWGYELFGDHSDDRIAHRQATEKVERLVEYLRSIQKSE
ncbi:MAG TPA: DUF6448 family protein [Steroidobacteraceae bacterium]|nr:DUF6448 family protein [Steroidobacteraceae bacterium]